ncbi:MAG: hypothetical protein ACRC8F_04025 [Cetobacterium sp.]
MAAIVKLPKEYYHAAYFINSLKLCHSDIRQLDDKEIIFLKERANELKIKNVPEFIKFIRSNKYVERFYPNPKMKELENEKIKK